MNDHLLRRMYRCEPLARLHAHRHPSGRRQWIQPPDLQLRRMRRSGSPECSVRAAVTATRSSGSRHIPALRQFDTMARRDQRSIFEFVK